MKQLLLIDSSAAMNGGAATPQNLTGMTKGSLGVYHLDDDSTWLAAAPTKDFALVLGRGLDSVPLIIPEVDIKTLSVVKTTPKAAVAFTASITIPAIVPGSTYTLVLVKNGTVPHERNTWTATHTVLASDTTTTPADVATILGNYFKNMAATGSINVSVTVSSALITITGSSAGEGWTLKAGDDLQNVTITSTSAEPAVGDKAYMEQLASMCAAGKGFTDTYADGDSIYPGYPEVVENTTYNIYTLRFAVGRKAAKTRDERVWQVVHIGVPVSATSATSIDTIIGQIKATAPATTTTTTPGS